MNPGRYILSQVLDLVDRKTLFRLVQRYGAESRVRHFGCRQQFICMAFAQLTWREGLRDIATCLNARSEALYHLGFREPVAKSTLADANEQRDWRLWEDLAKGLMRKARKLYAGEDLGLDLENTIYALDSTTIDLSLTLFPWADFRTSKAGIKMHTQLDLRGPIPTCIHITGARAGDVPWLDILVFEAGAFFVTRAKSNLRFSRHHSLPRDYSDGIRSDQISQPALPRALADFTWPLRRVHYFDQESSKDLVFLTNHLKILVVSVARIYKMRWQIELFFRWIKGHLRIKHYFGTSPNAVKTQIWISVALYLMVAILHKELKLPGSLHRTFQLLSVHSFMKAPIYELFTETAFKPYMPNTRNKLMLWDL